MRRATRRDADALNRDASCGGADPRLFDATELLTASPGLAYCARCPVTRLCTIVLDPVFNQYDGIAGGAVYKNGRRVATLNPRWTAA